MAKEAGELSTLLVGLNNEARVAGRAFVTTLLAAAGFAGFEDESCVLETLVVWEARWPDIQWFRQWRH